MLETFNNLAYVNCQNKPVSQTLYYPTNVHNVKTWSY